MKPLIRLRAVTLRPASGDDLDRLCGLLWQEDVRRYLCDDVVLPRATIASMLARSDALDAQSLGLWTIAGGVPEMAGVVGLQPASDAISAAMAGEPGQIEPVIALHPAAWGRGLGAAAIDALAEHAWRQCRLPRLVAAVDEPNVRSHRLMTRCNFIVTGATPGPRHRLRLYERRLGEAGLAAAPDPTKI
jgi:[ribosomal protein S5]-alanine N-acetyltransferase